MNSLFLTALLVAAASAAIINQELADDPKLIETFEQFDLSDDPDDSFEPDDAEVVNAVEVPVTEVTGFSNDTAACCSVGVRSGRLLAKSNHIRRGARNVVHVQRIAYRFGSRRINAIQIIHIGAMQGSRASIIAGGLNRNHVTIRLQSAKGRGYNYRIQIFGR